MFRADDNKVVGGDGDKANETIVNLFQNNKSRKLMCMPNIGATEKPNFLTPNAKKIFNYLQLAFIKASILQHFDLKSHIQIKTHMLGYTIDVVLG